MGGISWKDDCCKREDAIVETEVEYSKLKENGAGEYIVRGVSETSTGIAIT